MRIVRGLIPASLLVALSLAPAGAGAQHEGHEGHEEEREPAKRPPPPPPKPKTKPPSKPPRSREKPAEPAHSAEHPAAHSDSAAASGPMPDHEAHAFPALLGSYPASREASGTSWAPDHMPHHGAHAGWRGWSLMAHGFQTLQWNEQGGPRGGDQAVATSMLMGMASRRAGPGRLGLRTMLSLEPASLGPSGYPLLLQSGETADGEEHLIDRQHPHDLFMEMAGSYRLSFGSRSVFLYAGLPGEPALGPPVFMHRASGADLPDAPIAHHWLDSSHITFGVVTLGFVGGPWKVEGSLFRGREPDQHRYDVERPDLDSRSVRLSWNPGRSWALQASHGRVSSPEQLAPEIDVDRTTASVLLSLPGRRWHADATAAWGLNVNRPGRRLHALLAEATLRHRAGHALLARGEIVEKNELFEEGDPLAGRAFTVAKISLGYLYDFLRARRAALGLGAQGSVVFLPRDIEPAYGAAPAAGILFVRAALR